jgi:hypothetical protein
MTRSIGIELGYSESPSIKGYVEIDIYLYHILLPPSHLEALNIHPQYAAELPEIVDERLGAVCVWNGMSDGQPGSGMYSG